MAADLFWIPAVGDVVAVKERPPFPPARWPERITRVAASPGNPTLYWCKPLGPWTTHTRRNGTTFERGPCHETLRGADALSLWQGPLPKGAQP